MAQILLVGSDRDRAAGIRALLRKDGHDVDWLKSPDTWPLEERKLRPELVVAAVGSAERVLAQAGRTGGGFPAPLLFLQQDGELGREPFLEERLVDRISSPFMGEELLARVDALVRVLRTVRRAEPEGAANGVIKSRFTSWIRKRLPEPDKPVGPYLEVAAKVADWADRRDAFEPGHAERVASFCAMIAEGLQMDEQATSELLRAAMLHDIGKVALPVEILHQTRPLEDTQRRLIRTHPARGAALLRALDPDEAVARAVLYHHERPDGQGYYGKQDAGIPRAAHALAVAEAYDAMTMSRIRAPLSSSDALGYLSEVRGQIYDVDCVNALVDSLKPRGSCIPLAFDPR